MRPRWQIGIVENSIEGIVNGEKLQVWWLKSPYRDGWLADPFVLDVTEKEINLLVEDYRYKDGKGRIAKVMVNRQTKTITNREVVLKGEHYSFPAILRKDGRVYIYPEQSRQGRLDLFEYCPEKETCKFVETLSEEPLTDAIIYKGEIYSTRMPDPNGKRLGLFKWSSSVQDTASQGSKGLRTFKCPSDVQDATSQCSIVFGGLKQLHGVHDYKALNFELETLDPPKTFVFGECIARNAGDFFEVDGVTYRPAQECNRWYGNALSIQKYENGTFTEIRRIPGIHTLNSYEGVTVVDRKIFPYKWLYWLLRRTDK